MRLQVLRRSGVEMFVSMNSPRDGRCIRWEPAVHVARSAPADATRDSSETWHSVLASQGVGAI